MGNPISSMNAKISQMWWQAPVIPATWEAEAGESLELGASVLDAYIFRIIISSCCINPFTIM